MNVNYLLILSIMSPLIISSAVGRCLASCNKNKLCYCQQALNHKDDSTCSIVNDTNPLCQDWIHLF